MTFRDLELFFTRMFRKRRFRNFQALFPAARHPRVLDIGGTPDIWEMLDYPSEVTLLNVSEIALKGRSRNPCRRYITVLGDGRKLQWQDRSYDLAFANSVIEHVGDEHDAVAFAGEMRRVARGVYCQTPNKWFPIEPHLGALFLHWVPIILNNYYVVRYCTLWGLLNRPTRQQAREAVSDIRLLTKSELRRLFPDAEIRAERFLFVFAKSYVAIRRG